MGDDRDEICELIARYAILVDSGEFDAVTRLFTPDAVVDFSAFGGPVGPPPLIQQFLTESLGLFRRTQHLMGLPSLTVEGDRATARTPCTNPMVIDDADGSTKVWLIGLWYDDELVRTADGWRFAARRQQRCYSVVGLPDTPLGPA